MATKRMFSNDIIDRDGFYDLPIPSQLLYFHLGMKADVHGFVEPKKICRLVALKIEDIKPLIQEKFVIAFKSGVVVITDWNVNNNTREDREAPTQFSEEYSSLTLSQKGKYELQDNSRSTPAQIRLDKIRLDKINNNVPVQEQALLFIDKFNKLFNREFRMTKDRVARLQTRLKTYTIEEILQAVENLSKSDFHRGDNDRNWKADPDFLIRNDSQIDKWLNYKCDDNEYKPIPIAKDEMISPNGEIVKKQNLGGGELYE